MRKLLHFSFILAAIMAISFGADAKPVTAIQAIQRATGKSANMPKSMKAVTASPQLVHTFTASATETVPMVYLFSRGADRGYLIAPADDLFPAVLGYSDKGDFDAENMPPAMKAFLEGYAREIDYALKHNAEELATTASLFDPGWEPIRPLMTTQWNQDAPYNNQCPTVGSSRTYTGCVATSMAQVMKYHNWPDRGVGSNSYSWNGQTLSMNFANVKFDWNNMIDNYSSGYTDTQANAVAQLMKAVGYSVNMGYGTNASGASTRNQTIALVKYFKYSKAVRYLDRDVVSSTEFEKIIYDNLAEGLPVLYDGGSSSGAHSFVCDGYAGKHYFHFNWGWGGSSDGYFYLCRLNPHDQGIGSSDGGYNSGQGINYNIRPVRNGIDTGEPETYTANIVCDGDFTYNSSTYSFTVINRLSGQESAFWNWSLFDFVGSIGVIVRNSENFEKYFVGTRSSLFEDGIIPPSTGFPPRYFNPSISGLAPGEYTVHPAFKENSADEPQLMKVTNGCKGYVKLRVGANGSLRFTEITQEDITKEVPDMMVNCFSTRGEVFANQNTNFLISVTNLSNSIDYYGKLKLVVKDEGEEEVFTHDLGYYDVPASLSIPNSVNIKLELEPAIYYASVIDNSGRELPGRFPIEVVEGDEDTEITSDVSVLSCSPLDVVPGTSPDFIFQIKYTGTISHSSPRFEVFYRPVDSFDKYSFTDGEFGFGFTMQKDSRYSLRYPEFPFNQLSEGEYDIFIVWTSSPNGGEIVSPKYRLCVGHPVETVTINEQGKELEKDDELQLTTTLSPENATYTTLSWNSSDSNVVSVDNEGYIRALSPGTAYISATAHNGTLDHTMVVVKGNSAIEDIDADELRTVNAVYTISGVKILSDPTESEIMNLDAGIYIFQTPKRAFTVRK